MWWQQMHILVMYSTHEPTPHHIERLAAFSPSIEVTVARNEQMAIENAKDANIILGHRYLRQCLPYTQQLRWVQTTAGGVNQLPCLELAHQNVCLTRSTLSSPMIARHAVTLAWALTRCLPQCWQQQSLGIWSQPLSWLPMPRRAIIFGTGSIGRCLAQILSQDGIEVTGVKRQVGDETIPGFSHLFDTMTGLDALPEMDWCFLALPYTRETENLFNELVMCRLPSHAVIVNVGRGETLVTSDLCRILCDGHLGGAALDVIAPKPEAKEDPVWRVPRLLITPYVASHCQERSGEIERFCEEQLGRFLTGQPLVNMVDIDSLINPQNDLSLLESSNESV